jgi:ATP-binding cassette, subfamily B (MDR/TAP), member 1
MISIKTILSLNYQRQMLRKYTGLLENDPCESLKRGAKVGVFFGISLAFIILGIGSEMFGYDHIIPKIGGKINVTDLTVVLTTSMWCGWVAGNSFFFASHAASGKLSAKKVFSFLETNNEAEEQKSKSSKNLIIPAKDIKGRIELKNVSFKYGSKYILKDLSLVIEAGQKAAFVGESGCGKSTVMLLLQRFYDFEGEITLDGRSIYDYDLATYRSYFAVLNQEPSLFTGTVRQNVLFGAEVSERELSDACKSAHAFDANLAWKGTVTLDECVKEFLDRDAGLKGSKVSGGEKQRLACARALLKTPRIFLMDEGTSALDPET